MRTESCLHMLIRNKKEDNQMPFTQEHGYNISGTKQTDTILSGHIDFTQIIKCDGCNLHCELKCKMCNYGCHIYPAIDDRIIDWFLDENGNKMYTARNIYTNILKPVELTQEKTNAIRLAHRIATLCDHYKVK